MEELLQVRILAELRLQVRFPMEEAADSTADAEEDHVLGRTEIAAASPVVKEPRLLGAFSVVRLEAALLGASLSDLAVRRAFLWTSRVYDCSRNRKRGRESALQSDRRLRIRAPADCELGAKKRRVR